jgi:hypothetical protein
MRFGILALVALTLLIGTAFGAKPKVEWKPLAIGGMQEMGMLQSGIWKDINEPFRDEWVDHFGAYLTREAIVEERLRITVGLGGIFEFPKPEVAQAEFGGSQAKGFFLGPSIAEGVYSFGDVKAPAFQLGMGMFPFKYNPDAQNLGEYLFRSGPYPTFINTGGFALIRNAGASLQGFKASYKYGGLKVDGLLFTETGLPPLYDWSLAAVAGYTMADGLLEIGAGVNFKHLLQVRPSKTTPRNLDNAYFQKNKVWYAGSPEEYTQKAGFRSMVATDRINLAKADLVAINVAHPALAFLVDPTLANLDSAMKYVTDMPSAMPLLREAKNQKLNAQTFSAIADSIKYWTKTDSVVDPVSGNKSAYVKPAFQYFSSAGVLLMARTSLDLKKLFPSDLFASQDLKIFAEVALLGVKNYEVYYTHRTDRMPVMVGVNVPTFKLLDLVSIQGEYFHSPYANNFLSLGNAKATPYFPQSTNKEFSRTNYYDAGTQDDISWSVLLKKQILPGLNLYGQFARDHVRTVGTDWFFGSRLEPNEIMNTSKDWYWMTMVSWDL